MLRTVLGLCTISALNCLDMVQGDHSAVWYVQTKQSTSGPFTAQELARKLQNRELSADVRVKAAANARESTSLEEFVRTLAAASGEGESFSPPPRPDLPTDGPTHSMIVARDPEAVDPAVGLFDALQAAKDKAADQKRRRGERHDAVNFSTEADDSISEAFKIPRSFWVAMGTLVVFGGLVWGAQKLIEFSKNSAKNLASSSPEAGAGGAAAGVNPPIVPAAAGGMHGAPPLPPPNVRGAAQTAPVIPNGAPLSPIRPNFSAFRGSTPAASPARDAMREREEEARRKREREEDERRRDEERKREEDDRRRMDELRDRMDREGTRGEKPANPNEAGGGSEERENANHDDAPSSDPSRD